MCDDNEKNYINNKNSVENSKGAEDMSKTARLHYPESRHQKIANAIKEVKDIEAGKLPKKTARDFLKESRNS